MDYRSLGASGLNVPVLGLATASFRASADPRAGIGDAVDRIRIMAYDYSVSEPGPVSVQAASDVNTQADRDALQDEVAQLKGELERIVERARDQVEQRLAVRRQRGRGQAVGLLVGIGQDVQPHTRQVEHRHRRGRAPAPSRAPAPHSCRAQSHRRWCAGGHQECSGPGSPARRW